MDGCWTRCAWLMMVTNRRKPISCRKAVATAHRVRRRNVNVNNIEENRGQKIKRFLLNNVVRYAWMTVGTQTGKIHGGGIALVSITSVLPLVLGLTVASAWFALLVLPVGILVFMLCMTTSQLAKTQDILAEEHQELKQLQGSL